MIFVDASFYLSVVLRDSNFAVAAREYQRLKPSDCITSQAVLGEVLTVGSMKLSRSITTQFVSAIMDSDIRIVLENSKLVMQTWSIFQEVTQKDVGWVDCYTLAIMKQFNVLELRTFDVALAKLANTDPMR